MNVINIESTMSYVSIKMNELFNKSVTDNEKIDYANQMVYWDVETFQPVNKHVVYASQWSAGKQNIVAYGEKALGITFGHNCQGI